ncbi:MAG: TerC family protein [Verrucomicrobiales bacterium]|nr:TerC family protein [Verrucomicrobiales bacterium]
MDLLQNLTDFSWVGSGAAWIGLITLVVLEVVLGIDNIVFISILTSKLPEADRAKARRKGLILAVIPRLVFLLLLGLILSLQKPLFTLPIEDPQSGYLTSVPKGTMLGFTGKDLVMLVGGLFLIVQAVKEIHHKIEGGAAAGVEAGPKVAVSIGKVMIQIMLMNVIFSLDSIITAVGMVKEIPIMIIAVLLSTAVMIFAVNPISNFVEKHPAVKMLALAFLLLIGTNLLAESAHFHIPKGYVYFAMAFSVVVEVLNIRASLRGKSASLSHPVA